MTFNEILYIIYLAAGLVVGIIPAIIGFVKAHKEKKTAKTIADTEAAEKDMIAHAETLIVAAEDFYKSLDTILKSQNESAGPYKKESVLSKLQAYATEKGYKFDINYWSEKINQIVALTKSVNAK